MQHNSDPFKWRHYAPDIILLCGAKAFYLSQKAKGKSHHWAVRSLAYKWIRIISRCWQTRTNYDEARYVECLRKKGSKLVAESMSATA